MEQPKFGYRGRDREVAVDVTQIDASRDGGPPVESSVTKGPTAAPSRESSRDPITSQRYWRLEWYRTARPALSGRA